MTIQHSVSASDTFDEKIRAAEERAQQVQAHLQTIADSNNIKNSKRAFYKIAMWAYLGSVGMLFLFLAAATIANTLSDDAGNPVATFIMSSIVFVPLFLGFRAYSKKVRSWGNDDVVDRDAEQELSRLIHLIETWKSEKRSFLISHNVNIVKNDHILKDTESGIIGGDEKECPRCAENVKSKAKICRYCGHEFQTP